MNKYLKYILVFITVFLSVFIKNVDAASKTVLQCTYDNGLKVSLDADGYYSASGKYKGKIRSFAAFSNGCPSGITVLAGSVYGTFGYDIIANDDPDYEKKYKKARELIKDKFEEEKISLMSTWTPEDGTQYDPGYEPSDPSEGETVDDPSTCYDVLGSELVQKIQKYFNYIKIVVPIIILIFAVLDFGNAVLNSDGDQLKKSQVKLAKRLIVAVIIFLLPTFISFILRLVGNNSGTCGVR